MRTLLALFLLVPAALPQSRQERGKQVVMDALAALGGDNFLNMRDRVETGRVYSFYEKELSGLAKATIYTQYLPPASAAGSPDKLLIRERQAFGKEEEYYTLFEPDKGWQVTFRGARPLHKEDFDRYYESTRRGFFYILRERLHEPGLIFESKGTDTLDLKPVEIVDIIDADNDVTTVYFNVSDKLPVRQIFYRRDPKTHARHEELTIYAKYRSVGNGIMWPFTMSRFRDGNKVYEIFADSVAVNQDLGDHLFVLPTEIQKLPEAR